GEFVEQHTAEGIIPHASEQGRSDPKRGEAQCGDGTCAADPELDRVDGLFCPRSRKGGHWAGNDVGIDVPDDADLRHPRCSAASGRHTTIAQSWPLSAMPWSLAATRSGRPFLITLRGTAPSGALIGTSSRVAP